MIWLPITISIFALLISIWSISISRQGLKLAEEDYFAQRTVILSSSIRPQVNGPEFKKMLFSTNEEDKKKASQLLKEGYHRAIFVFIPSQHPSGVKDITLYFPEEVNGFNSLTIQNIAKGQLTQQLQNSKVIQKDEFGFPAQIVVPKLYDYLQRITPERNKVDNGTLNTVKIPIVIEVKMILKGRVHKEFQLYWADISFQVSEKNEPLVQNFTIDFIDRLKNEKMISPTLRKRVKEVTTFFSEPLPKEK